MHEIVIVEDHPLVSLGISLIVAEILPGAIIHHTSSVESTIELLGKIQAEIIIMDVNISGGGSPKMVKLIRARQENVPILISSGINERRNAIDFYKAGVNGFLSKSSGEEEYRFAITTILAGRHYMSNAIQKLILEQLAVSPDLPLEVKYGLSPREKEVMDLLVVGKQCKEIAAILRLKLTTVSAHKIRILKKLKTSNLVEFVEKVTKELTKNEN